MAETEEGKQVNLEIQVARRPDMASRALYYWTKLYEQQLKEGQLYSNLKKAITINILNFNYLSNDHFHSIYHVTEDHTNTRLSDHLEIHFLELPKLVKKPYAMDNRLWKWLMFIKGAPKEMWEELAMDTPGMKKAMNTLEFISQSEKERALALAREKALRDELSSIEAAEREGMAIGIKQGIEQGKLEVVESMLRKNSLSIQEISEMTGIAEGKIQQMKASKKH